jgi:thiamine biosynthesis lipoprotein
MSLLRYSIISFSFLLFACNAPQEQALVYIGETMGTAYSITLPGPFNVSDPISQEDIDALLESINRSLSTYITDPELSRLNQSDNTDWQGVSEELFSVLSAAQLVSSQSGGAFDVTIGSIVNLWGFGPDKAQQVIPDEETIMTALQKTGHEYLSLRANPRAIKKDIAEIYLDLSGIAKGYAVDHVAELLELQGFTDYLVEIGGEVRARGHNQKGEIWRIGIEKPMVESREIQKVIALDNMSMATSGDYRNFFVHEGERYSHTVDPASGWPVGHKDQSVTVLHESAMMADALATALSVMNVAQGLAFAKEHDLAVLYIQRRNGAFNETFTPAFTQYLVE